jgi:pimeloyl-ACP methyl ester carboxylesterase
MSSAVRVAWLAILAGFLLPVGGQNATPLVIKEEGSFFVGGETKTLPSGGGDITVNQMYVQYQIPMDAGRHAPVVMVHGCCLSSKTWETTPDGRMGWSEYFVRRNHAVYLTDQVARGRSGFDGTLVAAKPSTIRITTHQMVWSMFRLGPKFNTPWSDGQFPVEAADELYKQIMPDLNATLPDTNPTWANLAALAARLKRAVLMGHSQAGFFPELAAVTNPAGVKGIVSIEMPCGPLPDAQLSLLVRIPILILFGDHLDPAGAYELESCQKFVQQMRQKGGRVELMNLPKMGIKGNSHMLMQDRNNLQIADLILGWIAREVEGRPATKPK